MMYKKFYITAYNSKFPIVRWYSSINTLQIVCLQGAKINLTLWLVVSLFLLQHHIARQIWNNDSKKAIACIRQWWIQGTILFYRGLCGCQKLPVFCCFHGLANVVHSFTGKRGMNIYIYIYIILGSLLFYEL